MVKTKNPIKTIEEKLKLEGPVDLTQEARLLGEYLSKMEKSLQERFYKRNKSGKILTDKQISKMREDIANKWISEYKTKDKFSADDLIFVPTFVIYEENDLAKKITEGVMLGDRVEDRKFDDKNNVIYHGRSFKYADLGGNFVSINDQINLVRALVSTGNYEKAREVMDITKELLVKTRYVDLTNEYYQSSSNSELRGNLDKKMKEVINLVKNKGIKIHEKYTVGPVYYNLTIDQSDVGENLLSVINELKNNGFNVSYNSLDDIVERLVKMGKPTCLIPKGPQLEIESTSDKIEKISVLPYVNFNTGKLCECDENLYRSNNSHELLKYLDGELTLGNKDLVSKVMESLYEKYCHTFLNVDYSDRASNFLRIWKYLDRSDEPEIIKLSRGLLEKCLIPEWGLYVSFPLKSYNPKMQDLGADDQLNIALLHLYDGNLEEVKKLLTLTKKAGLYEKGKFIDRHFCSDEVHLGTNALAMAVLKALENPDILRKYYF